MALSQITARISQHGLGILRQYAFRDAIADRVRQNTIGNYLLAAAGDPVLSSRGADVLVIDPDRLPAPGDTMVLYDLGDIVDHGADGPACFTSSWEASGVRQSNLSALPKLSLRDDRDRQPTNEG